MRRSLTPSLVVGVSLAISGVGLSAQVLAQDESAAPDGSIRADRRRIHHHRRRADQSPWLRLEPRRHALPGPGRHRR